MSEVFGPIVHKAQIERALIATLATWDSTYLTEVERQSDYDTPLPRPRLMAVQSIQRFSEDHYPLVMVRGAGTTSVQRHGGMYRATWAVELVALSAAIDEEASNEIAGMYLAAAKALLVHKPNLGGLAESTVWTGDEPPTRLESDVLQRLVAVQSANLAVEIPDALAIDAGPLAPDVPPDHPADWPTADTSQVAVTRQP